MASHGNNENPDGNPVPKANGAAPQDGDADNADAQSHISEPSQLADPPPVVAQSLFLDHSFKRIHHQQSH